jgi:hypothetical protein
VNVDIEKFPKQDHIEIVEIDVPTASIIQHQIRNYYHWILESLPKLLFLNEHLLKSHPEIHVLIPEHGISNLIDTTLSFPELAHLKDRFIEYKRPSSTRYLFKKGLHIVDWIHPSNDIHNSLTKNLWSAYWPPREAIIKVRDFFHGLLASRDMFPSSEPSKIVYVSRGSSTRSFPNDREFIEYLTNRFGKSVVKVHRGSEPLLEQVQLFANAKVVLG